MNSLNKSAVIAQAKLGYISAFGGIEIKNINYEAPNVTFVAGAWTGNKSVHTCRIYNDTNGQMYFLYKGTRLKFTDIIVDASCIKG